MLLSRRCNTIHQEGVNWFYSCLKTLLDFFFPLLFAFITVHLSQMPDTYLRKRSSMLKLWLTPLTRFH